MLKNDLAKAAAFGRCVKTDKSFCIALNGRKRCAQLVRHIGHKVAPHTFKPHELCNVVEHSHRTNARLPKVLKPRGTRYTNRHHLTGRKLQLQIALLPANCGLIADTQGIALAMRF